MRVESIQRNDVLCAYEVTGAITNDGKKDAVKDAEKEEKQASDNEEFAVPLLHSEIIREEGGDDQEGGRGRLGPVLGCPLAILASRATTPAQLHAKIAAALAPLLPRSSGAKMQPRLFLLEKGASASQAGPEVLGTAKGNDGAGLTPGVNVLLAWPDAGVMGRVLKQCEPSQMPVKTAKREAKSKELDIYACLEQFSRPEKLTKNNAWYCRKCKVHQEAEKKLELYRFPEILVVCLKRFVQVSAGRREKNGAFVDFPIKGLDLSDYVIAKAGKSAIYDLFAVSNHMG
jgi:hypothetical protein